MHQSVYIRIACNLGLLPFTLVILFGSVCCSLLGERLPLLFSDLYVTLLVGLALRVLVDIPAPDDAPDVATDARNPHEQKEAAEVTTPVLGVAARDPAGPDAEENAADENPQAHGGGDVTLEVLERLMMLVDARLTHCW